MLIDSVATHAYRTPDALACVDLETGRQWSYRQCDAGINRIAHWLVSELGPASGSRVVTVARNSADILMLYLACVRAGAIYVPCNWRLSAAEVASVIADAEPSLVFYDEEFYPQNIEQRAYLTSELVRFSDGQPTTPPQHTRRSSTDTSLLLYTSGTSGHPKGVMLSEENAMWSQISFNLGNQVHSRSVFLCDMPMFHTAGLLANARSPLLAGGTLLVSRGFDAEKTLARLSDSHLGVTHYFSVPQMASLLWSHPQFDAEKLRHLEVYATGGAPNPNVQIERFVNAGIPMSDGFGMTETGSVSGAPVDSPEKIIEKAGSSGTLYFSLEARIAGQAGEPLLAGEVGELWLKGPGVTSGYWNQPDKTREAFSDGWFKTGDMARIDAEGYLFIVDRKKDMFISGGENVYCTEVEGVIAGFPGVDEVAIIGAPDEKWGEIGVAFIASASMVVLKEDNIKAYCRERLAAYKVPRHIVIRSSLPRTSTGKIQKQQLREAFSEQQS